MTYLETCVAIAFTLLGLALVITIWRVLRGPSLADRVLGLDTVTVLSMGVIGVFAVAARMYVVIDVAVALGLVGFVATAAFARYLLGHREDE